MSKSITLVTLLFAVGLADVAVAEYSFEVTNSTKVKVVKLEVSEEGGKWGEFDIGDGIAPGETAKIVWDESTDDQECEQKVKATYADKSKTDIVKFDFCEEDLSLELK